MAVYLNKILSQIHISGCYSFDLVEQPIVIGLKLFKLLRKPHMLYREFSIRVTSTLFPAHIYCGSKTVLNLFVYGRLV